MRIDSDSRQKQGSAVRYASARVAAALLLVIATGSNGLAQNTARQRDTHESATSSRGVKRDVELESILDLTNGVPPEFGADALMRLAQSTNITDPALKAKLLEKAFYLAESAQQPIKLVALPGSAVDTRSGYLALAFRLNMDQLSLQSKAVANLLQLDRVKGAKLFEQIRFPMLKPLGCEESLIYDPSLYYETLASVLKGQATTTEDSEKRVIALLRPAVSGISSHTQVSPVVMALISLNLSPVQLSEMSSFLAGSLERLQGDEGSFAVVANKYGALGALTRLISKLEGDGSPSANLLGVSRQYVVQNLRDIRCVDNKPEARMSLPTAAVDFNELFGVALLSSKLNPIGRDELQNYRPSPGSGNRVCPLKVVYWREKSMV